jgi:hypothetical protein
VRERWATGAGEVIAFGVEGTGFYGAALARPRLWPVLVGVGAGIILRERPLGRGIAGRADLVSEGTAAAARASCRSIQS